MWQRPFQTAAATELTPLSPENSSSLELKVRAVDAAIVQLDKQLIRFTAADAE
jgi:hypothetical protein